jgi:Smg protein
MFDVLVYLYETYFRPDACPDSVALAKKLSAVGFEEEDISEALNWLSRLAETTNAMTVSACSSEIEQPECQSFRIYTETERAALGVSAMGFLYYLESTNLLNMQQREIVIERAMAINESPISLEKLKVVVLMLLWSQGSEPDMLMFDELLLSDENTEPRHFH